ncbi:esterase/lipase family protein [Nocardia fluminea]|uniref:esterase/lipase family protein n=1 Tax=Nocardia fluminea TaxID=134984 RepID=UPI003D0E0755
MSARSWLRAAVLAPIITGMCVSATAHAAPAPPAAGQLPVPWTILAAVGAQLSAPGQAPAGTNDWTCRPSAEHPKPVVLVHGGFINQTLGWQTMAPLLANAGYCVFSLNFGQPNWPLPSGWTPGAMRPVQDNAAEIGQFITRVRESTGADKVDVLAQSFGTLSTNHYAKYLGGADYIDRFVALSPLWEGTTLLGLHQLVSGLEALGLGGLVRGVLDGVNCAICDQVLNGSDYLTQLAAEGTYAPGVTYTNITSRYDVLLTPYTTSLVPGPDTTNIDLQAGCPQDLTEHFSIGASRRVAAHILNALDPVHPVAVPCQFTTPLGG